MTPIGVSPGARPWSACRALKACACAVALGGCAAPQVVPKNDPGAVTSVAEARAYIRSAVTEVNAKTTQLVDNGQASRAGVFIGTLGLGAAALANLHKDAAIGFATLAAISSQGLPLAGPPIWIPICEEASVALRCLGGVALRLDRKLKDLKLEIAHAASVERDFTDLDLKKGNRTIPVNLTREIRSMRAAVSDASAEASKEPEVADAIYETTQDIVAKLNELLRKNQPSVEAFKVAATSIVTQATAAGTPPPSPPATGAGQPLRVPGIVGARPERPSAMSDEEFAARVEDLFDRAHGVRTRLELLLQARLGDEIAKGTATGECKARLVGAVLPVSVNDAAKSDIVLGNGTEKTVIASGGSGIFLGTWVNATPSAGLIEPPTLPSMGIFKFKQLKKDATEQVFTYRIWDSANSVQLVEIKIKVPSEH